MEMEKVRTDVNYLAKQCYDHQPIYVQPYLRSAKSESEFCDSWAVI